jgi:pyruvate kinase
MKTKVICTIGPAVDNYDNIVGLIENGMDVVRLNFSHGTHEYHSQIIAKVKQARDTLKVPLAIMLDTRGPEVRVGKAEIQVKTGDKITLGEGGLPIVPADILDNLEIGSQVLFDDGFINSKVVEKGVVEILNDGVIKAGKGVNVPGIDLGIPAITKQDITDITFGCEHDIELIAASFISYDKDIIGIKKLLSDLGRDDILVIAKIENSLAVQNFDSILQVADGIMIARGDLGVEVPLSKVPLLQKMMIRKCSLAGKPSIVATQMLESMIYQPRPTRAEASDVANAIFDSTSMVMLSGETAIGKYPLETVSIMEDILKATEDEFDYCERFRTLSKTQFHDTPSAVAMAAVETGYSTQAKAIFVRTNSGRTAKLVSRLRPSMTVLAMTPNKKVYNQMAMFWGIIPVLGESNQDIKQAYDAITSFALEQDYVEYGDLIVMTSDAPLGITGTTSMMVVKSIGDVLVRGHTGYGRVIQGKVAIIHSPEITAKTIVRGHLLVLPQCDESYLPIIKEASGIILENHIEDIASEDYAITLGKALDIPVIVRADMARNILRDEQLITLDPKNGLIYNGSQNIDIKK